MNKRILTFALIVLSSVMFISCVSKKKTVTAPVVDAPKLQAPKVEEAGTLVPFTRELFFKLRENGLDIKKLKFYVDNTIALNKTANAANLEINEMSGILINKKGVSDNLIKITPQVVGMVESVEPDGLRLNFGRPNSSLKFINNTLSPKFFAFAGDKVDKATGSVEVMYNSSTYKATSESGGSPTDIKLMIKQLDIETGLSKGVVEPGAGKTLLGY
jgi:hypothetical protein